MTQDNNNKPREWWIETHEVMKNKKNIHGEPSWPQVYQTDLGHTINVIEKSAYDALAAKLAASEGLRQVSIEMGDELIAHAKKLEIERDKYAEAMAIALKHGIFPDKYEVKKLIKDKLQCETGEGK